MGIDFKILRATRSDWRRVADIRIRSLAESPQWFSGHLEVERARTQSQWKSEISNSYWVIFTADGADVGLMTVAKADESRGTDCWVGGCWVTPELRGAGIMRAMIRELDQICLEQGWVTQGLGVFPENVNAIRAYERSGFVRVGELQQSRSRPEKMFQMMKRGLS